MLAAIDVQGSRVEWRIGVRTILEVFAVGVVVGLTLRVRVPVRIRDLGPGLLWGASQTMRARQPGGRTQRRAGEGGANGLVVVGAPAGGGDTGG